jgi:U3 small nucleolar RNA-associated protein 11
LFALALQKVERMQQSLHLLGAPATNQHIVFVDEEEEAETFDPARHFDTAPELLERAYNRPRLQQLTDAAAVSGGGGEAAAATSRLEK